MQIFSWSWLEYNLLSSDATNTTSYSLNAPFDMNLFKAFVLCLVVYSMTAEAVTKRDHVTVSADKSGLWGVEDATGTSIILHQYAYAEALEDGYFVVGQPTKNKTNTQPNDYGVVDSQNKEILPIKYSGINYDKDFKRFKVRLDVSESASKFGIFDEHGKVVIPVIYDYMERISNSGDEPVNIVKKAGKFGYINLISGKLMIPVEYDSLSIGERNTDAQGNGIAVASKNNKYGVLSTNGAVVAPFEFDGIGDVESLDGIATGASLAEKDGKLVVLRFEKGKCLGTSEAPNIYSSKFAPHPPASINPKPFDGLYKAEDYPTMKSAWDAWKNNQLRWVAMPSIQINGDLSYVAFGQFTAADRLGFLPNEMGATKQKNGFTITTDFYDESKKKNVKTNLFSFTQSGDVMLCNECARSNLPTRWRLVKGDKPQEFAGIGVAIKRLMPSDELILVQDVLANGPAAKAGLKAGDNIVKIDNVPVSQYVTIDDVTKVLRGPIGTKVKVKYIRGGSAYDVLIERGLVKYN